MRGLPAQGARLRRLHYLVPIHHPFAGLYARVRERVVRLHAEPMEILQHIYLHTHVGGVAQVQRHIISILPLVYKAVLYRVSYMLVEQSHHELLGGARKELPPKVHVVGHGVPEIRIALLLVILVYYAVRHYLEQARTVDGPVIGEMQVHVLPESALGMQVRQPVRIPLSALRVRVARIFEPVSLVCMLHAYPRCKVPSLQRESRHGPPGPYAFMGRIVERVTHIAIFARG